MKAFKQKSETQQNNKSKWIYWALVLVLAINAILFTISFLSNKRCRIAIEDKLNGETAAYAAKVGGAIDNIIHEATGAAAIIGSEDLSNSVAMKNSAVAIAENSSIAYLTMVTDLDGAGYASTGDAVNISGMDYFCDDGVIQCSYIGDDGVLNKPAYVAAVPYVKDGNVAGYVYLFEDINSVYRFLPTKSYGTGLAFAIVGEDGEIVNATGANSHFNKGDNFVDNLEDAEVKDLTIPQIRFKIEKQVKALFYASFGKESRAIILSPTGVSGWELAVIINTSYIDSVVDANVNVINRLIIITVIVLFIFIAFLSAVYLISKFRQSEENKDLEDKADTDLLTGLNNKIATERKIQEYMTENPNTQSLMFLFDIDNFKKINDTMGHSFGDEVLRTLGHQLANEFRVTDIIGRLGGDEFVVFLKNVKNEDQLEREGQRITNLFHHFKAGDYVKYSATASIGAVVFPKDAKDFQSAYKAADKALYEAKRRGKNQLVFYGNNLAEMKSIKGEETE